MKIQNAVLIGVFVLGSINLNQAAAQEPQASPNLPKTVESTKSGTDAPQTKPGAANSTPEFVTIERAPIGSGNNTPDVTAVAANTALSEEEAAIVPYYNNFMKDYRLGPEDVISVEVFAQCPNYCKTNITVPPDGTISYPLIRDGVFVVGKTRQQIADEITKKLDEFIIDPKVMVSLDKAMSKRYSVLGDVGKPGVQIMARKLSIYEAIAEAGGILPTGNQKEVVVLRSGADGTLSPITVNVKLVKGKPLQMMYLEPGDQIIVPGNKIKTWQKVMNMLPIIGFARGLLTGGF